MHAAADAVGLGGADGVLLAHLVEGAHLADVPLLLALALVLVEARAAAARVEARAVGRALLLARARLARLLQGHALAALLHEVLVARAHALRGARALGVVGARAQALARLARVDLLDALSSDRVVSGRRGVGLGLGEGRGL